MNILVVGGAGYIGSHMCKYLHRNGHRPFVLDNLQCGHGAAVKWGPLFKGSMSDKSLVGEIVSRNRIEAAMHFAAFCYVGESVSQPLKYYENNVSETLDLLEVLVREKVRFFIFSSSCATYGEPVEVPIPEAHPQKPINPYGKSKLMVEQILEDFETAYGLKSVALRYFNAAGADPEGEIGEDHRPETHLIPLALQTALGQRPSLKVFGGDYATGDGTCIRDYIHVEDLAQAHLLALERMVDGLPGRRYNLGNGKGYSVREVIAAARRISGKEIPEELAERRPGDPAVLVGSSGLAIRELGWKPRFADLSTIIETAWRWHRENPNGYAN